MPVQVERRAGVGYRLPFARHSLAALLAAMLEAANAKDLELDLLLVGDASMADCNRSHLGCAGPTNILSFPGAALPDGSSGSAALVLSVDTLHRECLLYGQHLTEHLVRLLAHGLGHCLGHDHGPVMDALCQRLEQRGHQALGSDPAGV